VERLSKNRPWQAFPLAARSPFPGERGAVRQHPDGTGRRGTNPPADTQLEDLVREVAGLRPLPAAVSRVLRIAEGEHFSAHELAQAIAADQALTARVLRLANSAYYGFPKRITSVRDAVVLLGFRTVRSATLASSVIGAFAGVDQIDHRRFWHFSVAVGMLAEVLARASRRHLDEAFTAGVLHNIGRLALAQHRPERLATVRQLARAEAVSLTAAETKVLGFTDAELGGALASHWNFPEELVEAVRLHSASPGDIGDPDSLAALVVQARRSAHAWGMGDGIEIAPPGGEAAHSPWSKPPISRVLEQAGGIDGVRDRATAFVDSAVDV
jgi:HD-like signal output (HDOD) protein